MIRSTRSPCAISYSRAFRPATSTVRRDVTVPPRLAGVAVGNPVELRDDPREERRPVRLHAAAARSPRRASTRSCFAIADVGTDRHRPVLGRRNAKPGPSTVLTGGDAVVAAPAATAPPQPAAARRARDRGRDGTDRLRRFSGDTLGARSTTERTRNMPKTTDKVANVAGTAKPYVDRALHDEELRDHVEAGLRGRARDLRRADRPARRGQRGPARRRRPGHPGQPPRRGRRAPRGRDPPAGAAARRAIGARRSCCSSASPSACSSTRSPARRRAAG